MVDSCCEYWRMLPKEIKPVIITVISILAVCSVIVISYKLGFSVGYSL